MLDKRELQLRPRIFLLLLVEKSGDHHQNASMKPVLEKMELTTNYNRCRMWSVINVRNMILSNKKLTWKVSGVNIRPDFSGPRKIRQMQPSRVSKAKGERKATLRVC